MEHIPGILALSIPILAIFIPIVAIFTNHQRKMAELYHAGANSQQADILNREIAMMREEISQLKAHQNNLAIQMDDLRKNDSQRSVTSQVAERLTNS